MFVQNITVWYGCVLVSLKRKPCGRTRALSYFNEGNQQDKKCLAIQQHIIVNGKLTMMHHASCISHSQSLGIGTTVSQSLISREVPYIISNKQLTAHR